MLQARQDKDRSSGIAVRSLGIPVVVLGAVILAAGNDDLGLGEMASGPAGGTPAYGARPVPVKAGSGPAEIVLSSDPFEAGSEVVQRVCVRCHNERRLVGNLSLEGFDVARAAENVDVAERMVRKLRAGMMPPPGARRPAGDTLLSLVERLETVLDDAARARPKSGSRFFQRLNRAEYESAVHDLLGLSVDAGEWLPADQMSANFDNIADVQVPSPTLVEAYLNAAAEISRRAAGDRMAPPVDRSYKNSDYTSQHPWNRLHGAPFGTRGGMVADHVFPADGEYIFRLGFSSGANSRLEDIDISVGGQRVALLHYARTGGGADGRGASLISTEPVFVRAGQRKVAAVFVRNFDGPYEDLIRPHDWSMAGGGSGGEGITTLPHLREMVVSGPYNVTGVSDSPSRQRIFACRPTTAAEEETCAWQIIKGLASRAYRRPAKDSDVDALMRFYEAGFVLDGFETGVRMALEALLASPQFIFRLEREPEGARAGDAYLLDNMDLASRLSFFLWGRPPDEPLLAAAASGGLHDPGELARQAMRMLKDPRADALGRRFAGQWLRLQDLYKVHPDPNFYPNFDDNLADAMRQETELFFNSLIDEDRSVLDFYRASYTFANERLAAHYGFPGVSGSHFRKVRYPDDTRQGLLGHGSILVLTSLANRTSPVLRGKWVMEVLLGTPPPPPPPGIPDLEETESSLDGRLLTTRERMEIHRENPACRSCHRFMDPIGLALDNFDVTGKWRSLENGMPLDTRGDFYDGTPVTTPADLSQALLRRPLPLVRTFTENLMAYALGRRVEPYDQPAIRAIVRAAEADDYRVSTLVLGVVKKRRVPYETGFGAGSCRRPCSRRDAGFHHGRPTDRAKGTYRPGGSCTMQFITGKHIPRRTFLRGLGASAALPLLDAMIPAGRLGAEAKATSSPTRLVCIEEVHGLAGCNEWGAAQNLFARPATGKNFEILPESALSPLVPFQDRLTIISNTDVRMAEAFTAPEIGGDHFRSSAVFLTQSHPKQTRARTSMSAPRWINSTPSGLDRTRRCPPCSSASKTWTKRAAAPTTTLARTPTRSAGLRRTSPCR